MLINSHGVPAWYIAIVIHKQNKLCKITIQLTEVINITHMQNT